MGRTLFFASQTFAPAYREMEIWGREGGKAEGGPLSPACQEVMNICQARETSSFLPQPEAEGKENKSLGQQKLLVSKRSAALGEGLRSREGLSLW